MSIVEIESRLDELNQQTRALVTQVENAAAVMEQVSAEITQWDEPVIHDLVDTVKVISKDQIEVYLRDGSVVKQKVGK